MSWGATITAAWRRDRWLPAYVAIALLFGTWLLDRSYLASERTYAVEHIELFTYKETSRGGGRWSVRRSKPTTHYERYRVLHLADGPSLVIPLGMGGVLQKGDTVVALVTPVFQSCLAAKVLHNGGARTIPQEYDLEEYMIVPIGIALIATALIFIKHNRNSRPQWRIVLVVLMLIWCVILFGVRGLAWL